MKIEIAHAFDTRKLDKLADGILKVRGEFDVKFYDAPKKSGTRNLIRREIFPNGSTTAGLNSMLSVYFNSGSQLTTWFFGLINNSPTPTLAVGDTIASHSGWSESTDYSESVRQTWTPGSPASGVITNPTDATFTMNATVTIYGLFLVSNSTKGGTTGTMWAHGAFGSPQSKTSGQTLDAKYTLTLG